MKSIISGGRIELIKKEPESNENLFILLTILLGTVVLTACGGLTPSVGTLNGAASAVVITEPRSASNFTAIDMRTLGNVNITQGQNESVTVKGSDNVVPLVQNQCKQRNTYHRVRAKHHLYRVDTE